MDIRIVFVKHIERTRRGHKAVEKHRFAVTHAHGLNQAGKEGNPTPIWQM